MIVKLKRENQAFHFQAENEDGVSISLDASPEIGGENKGFRPMQLLLAGIGGCSGIDIILILQKQRQKVDDFSIEVSADRQKNTTPALFENIHVTFSFVGTLDKNKVYRAVELSMEKYCSVAKILEKSASISYSVKLNGEKVSF